MSVTGTDTAASPAASPAAGVGVQDETAVGRAARRRWRGPDLAELLRLFPPRQWRSSWEATELDRAGVQERLLAPPLARVTAAGRAQQRLAVVRVLDWLEAQPGGSWQERWLASGAEEAADWRVLPAGWLVGTGQIRGASRGVIKQCGHVLQGLLSTEVIRPSLRRMLTLGKTQQALARYMALVRDPAGFAALQALLEADRASGHTKSRALHRIAVILTVKGGVIADITAGDCLQVLRTIGELGMGRSDRSPYFYQLLHAHGVFPPSAPPTVRMLNNAGQRSVEDLIDRYRLRCRPIRDLLVDYLNERRPGVDYSTLQGLAHRLGRLFWADLEHHHPGIDSLALDAQVATAWKQRVLTKTVTTTDAGGQVTRTVQPRVDGRPTLMTVRAFYLDIAQWALEDPSRWSRWAVPCPVRAGDTVLPKIDTRRKARMDQRTRERLPVLPVLVASADAQRKASADLLAAAAAAPPGQLFTAAGQTLRRAVLRPGASASHLWAEDPGTGRRLNLTRQEERRFWAWAIIEILRHTGIRIEELTELSHHSFVQYRLPDTGELIPLLHIAPSKTDIERLLVISPELADVLSTIVQRIRGTNGAVPLVISFDTHDKTWNPPMPLLLQRRFAMENRPLTQSEVRSLLGHALQATALTDPSGQPLRFTPHDFRRIFVTDAVMNGMPPHIAQLIVGHQNINTTMGYKAVYPQEAINGHRAFIARRRALRPSQEYRTPTDTEWQEFLGHFERRKVAYGTCGRAYATPCIHEHACIRCPMLRPDPTQRPRLIEVHNNLLTRIDEARTEGWLGELEGLKISLAAARDKIAELDRIHARRTNSGTVNLGIPDLTTAGRTLTTPPRTK